MIRFIIRRLIGVVILLWVVSVVTFSIFFLVPKLVGTNPALLYVGRTADQAAIHDAEIRLGLDKPVVVQYGRFAKGIVAGRDFSNGPGVDHCPAPCLGYSFKSNQSVTTILRQALPITASLAAGAAVMWVTLGVGAGIISALRKGTLADRGVMMVALAGVSLPVYFTGLLSLFLFSFGPSWLRLFPNIQYVSITHNPLTWARNLFLPWTVIAFLNAALYARLTRANMLETMNEDYIRTARAKGLPERTVIGRHGLRAALTPLITIFGLDLGGLLGGAVITEQVFGLQGVGKTAITAIAQVDLPVVEGTVLLAAFFIIMANLIVDVLYAFVDPRVKYS